jgi:protein-disulfide isomerase
MRAAKTLLFLLPIAAVACGTPKNKAPSADTPLAKIGKDTITWGDISKDVTPQLDQAEKRLASAKEEAEAALVDAKFQYEQGVYQAKRGALEKIISDKLLAPLAKEKGLTVDQFKQAKMKEIVDQQPAPSEQEQRALYDQVKASGRQLDDFEKLQPQIVEYMKMQKAGPEAQKFFDDLEKKAGVQILLPPIKREVDAKGPSKGNAKAPVTIVEFSDFQCPYCVRAEPTVEQVLSAYGDKVRLVYRDYPLPMHPYAPKAAEASHCAEDQGKYWEMHGKLFATSGTANGELPVDTLKKLARDLGLDGAKFDKCLDSGEKKSVVDENTKAGRAAGVTGTPAFFINGRFISGALPLDEFKKIVDEELASK